MQKIGLFGGSFNPLHCGHVAMARAFADELALDSVLFVPAGNPYHKAHADVGREHRWQMVQCVTELDARFAASDVDLVREGKTYTIDTVQIFKQIYPNAQWWWLMGMDSFMTLHTWKHWQALVRQVSIAVAAGAVVAAAARGITGLCGRCAQNRQPALSECAGNGGQLHRNTAENSGGRRYIGRCAVRRAAVYPATRAVSGI